MSGFKKALGLFWVVIAVLSLAACGDRDEETEGNSDNVVADNGGEEVADGWVNAMLDFSYGDTFRSEGTIDLSLLFRELPETPWQDDWLMVQRLHDLTGINFAGNTIAVLNDDFQTQRQLLIASGDAPEIMPFMYGQYVAQFIPGGQLLPLDDYFQHMPHFMHYLQAWGLEEEFEQQRQEDGYHYWLPGLFESVPIRFTVAMRQDILDELGLDVPDTWDEIRDVLRVVEAAYPGTYPYQDAWGWDATANFSASTFGVRFGWGLGNGLILDWETNTHNHISQMPQLREFVEYWHSLINEGLMNPDSLSGAFGDDAWERFVNGYSFMVSTNGTPMHVSLPNDMAEILAEGTPVGPFGLEGASVVTLPIPNGPTGFVGQGRLNNGLVLNRSIREREDFVAIIQFIDWFFYSEEGREFSLWGVEGETFEWVDDRRQLMEGFTSPTFGHGGNLEMVNDWFQIQRDGGFAENVWLPTQGGSNELILSIMSEEMQQIATSNMNRITQASNPAPPYTVEEAEMAGPLQSQLADLTNVAVREFILGHRPMSEWDDFVQSVYNAGVPRLLEMADEAHRRARLVQ
jgi:putative aldouronate transport system substrate-binding protein